LIQSALSHEVRSSVVASLVESASITSMAKRSNSAVKRQNAQTRNLH
jgi:hypothetical protein